MKRILTLVLLIGTLGCKTRDFGDAELADASIPKTKYVTKSIPGSMLQINICAAGDRMTAFVGNRTRRLIKKDANADTFKDVVSVDPEGNDIRTQVTEGCSNITLTSHTFGPEVVSSDGGRFASRIPHLMFSQNGKPFQKADLPDVVKKNPYGTRGAIMWGNTLYVISHKDGLLVSNDFGKTYKPLAPFTKGGVSAVYENAGRTFVIDDNQAVWMRANASAAFEKLNLPATAAFPSVVAADGNTIAVGAQSGLFVSSDLGKTFHHSFAGAGGSGLRGNEIWKVAVKGEIVAAISFNQGSRTVSLSKNRGKTFKGLAGVRDLETPDSVLISDDSIYIGGDNSEYYIVPIAAL